MTDKQKEIQAIREDIERIRKEIKWYDESNCPTVAEFFRQGLRESKRDLTILLSGGYV